MVHVRSLAKELRSMEQQRQSMRPSTGTSTSTSPVYDDSAQNVTRSTNGDDPAELCVNAASSSETHTTMALHGDADSDAARDTLRIATDRGPSIRSTAASPQGRSPSPFHESGDEDSYKDLFALGKSRFDILMMGRRGDTRGCRTSNLRKGMRACGKTGVEPNLQRCNSKTAVEEEVLPASCDATGTATGPSSEPSGVPCAVPSRRPFKRLLPQPFSHVLVCDFEATCASGSVHYPHEIIEFPVVVVDTATLHVVAEFHRYVRPLRNPTLTTFCTELTGITQEMVDQADPLPKVVQQFQAWLESDVYPLCRRWIQQYGTHHLSRNLKSEQRRFVYDERTQESRLNVPSEAMICMATDGPWDMRRFMHECSVLRDGVEFPPLCYRYINVRHCFSDLFKCRQRKLTHMLQKMSMSFEGRRHSGIDDTRNIARVLAELFARGYRVHHVSAIKYTHRGDAHLDCNRAAQELLSEYGEDDRTHTRGHVGAPKGDGKRIGRKR